MRPVGRFLWVIAVIMGMLAVDATSPATAQNLDALKRQGVVGEQADGYLGIAPGGGGDIAAFVESVNAQRRARYQDLAARNNQPLATVEQLAGAKLIERAGAGEYVKPSGSGWVRR